MANDNRRPERPAPGGPGIAPRWTGSAKDAVGTAYASAGRVWFTLSLGILNEVYYPTIDRPQIRDLQFLITDGATFFHEERRLRHTVEPLSEHALGFRVTSADPDGRYEIAKEVIADPHLPCVLVRARLDAGQPALRDRLRLYALLAPHLEAAGWGNHGEVTTVSGRKILVAHRGHTWLALGATAPFLRASCGFVGENDGWTDLAGNLEMDFEFDAASNGNIALSGEIAKPSAGFTLGLGFGDTFHGAVTTLFQSLGIPYPAQRKRFVEQWERACRHLLPLEKVASDGGALYHRSQSLLLAHEDKTYAGATIASLSIPWGDAKGDEEIGGYHLVWTRDMVNSALGLLAAGNTAMPLRALIYLVASQNPDGGFPQNFWVNGEPYWPGIQLDEVAFPILLAFRLHRLDGLQGFDPYPMVLRAASYLVRKGPATPQERWEEIGGYSPSTLASNIAALTCAACLARERGDETTAQLLHDYSDFLECHVEPWTVTTDGNLLPGVRRHYIRIHPVNVADVRPEENPDRGRLRIANRAPAEQTDFAAKDIVDAGFLELVRYGIRRPGDPLIEDSLRVVDAVLKVDTPAGPCWRRYNHDGYGQRADGGPFEGSGVGRPWPLLTGERGHYELAAGRDVRPYILALERFAHATGLLPEQVWDEPDRPDLHLRHGRPTGAAMPLMWAHSEYVRLLRSVHDGRIFDLVPEVADRYLGARRTCRPLEIWKPNRQVSAMNAGSGLRVQAPSAFFLHWTADEWRTVNDTRSIGTRLGIEFVDILIGPEQRAPIRFTFRWLPEDRWEGRDYHVSVSAATVDVQLFQTRRGR